MNRSVLVIAVLAAALALPAGAQTAAERRSTWWVTLGAGQGDFGTDWGIGASVSGAYQFGRTVVAVRSALTGDILETLFASTGAVIGTEDFGVRGPRGPGVTRPRRTSGCRSKRSCSGGRRASSVWGCTVTAT